MKINRITFIVTGLLKPEEPLKMQSCNKVLEYLVDLSQKKDKKKPPYIIANSSLSDNIINFTTMTVVEKFASEITIMESMKAYFDYFLGVNYFVAFPKLHCMAGQYQVILAVLRHIKRSKL